MVDKIDNFIGSTFGRRVIIGVGIALIALMVFHAGFVAGSRRHGPPGGRMWTMRGPGSFEMRVPRGFIRDGHGAVGTVTSLTAESITLVGPDGATTTVLRSKKTQVRNFSRTATSGELTVGDHIMVLGAPQEDGIEADLIKILPPPPPPPSHY